MLDALTRQAARYLAVRNWERRKVAKASISGLDGDFLAAMAVHRFTFFAESVFARASRSAI